MTPADDRFYFSIATNSVNIIVVAVSEPLERQQDQGKKKWKMRPIRA